MQNLKELGWKDCIFRIEAHGSFLRKCSVLQHFSCTRRNTLLMLLNLLVSN